mgnify:FL=1
MPFDGTTDGEHMREGVEVLMLKLVSEEGIGVGREGEVVERMLWGAP